MEEKHTLEMERIINAYKMNVDKELYDFIQKVLHDENPIPITVGYLSQNQIDVIGKEIGQEINFAPRCIIDADAIRHIINRHGKNGNADNSMSNIQDIARLAYVLANFDEAIFDGNYSNKKYKLQDGSPAPHITLKKRIDGTYYIIEAVSDSKSNRSYIVSAYIKLV